MLKRVNARAIRYWLALLLIVFTALSPLASAQVDYSALTTPFYDPSAASCIPSPDSESTATASSVDLVAIAKKYDSFHSGIVKEVNGPVVASYHADQHPAAAASVLKLVIVDVFLHTNPDLDKKHKVTRNEVYEISSAQGRIFDPNVGQVVSLREALKSTIIESSNTEANVLINESGGLDKATTAAHDLGYTNTNIHSYYSASGSTNGRVNSSTVADLSKAMESLYTATGANYTLAKSFLQNEAYTFGLSSDANKWGGTSLVTANVAVFTISGKVYIIGLYFNAPWSDSEPYLKTNASPSPSVGWLKDSTNQIVASLSGSGGTSSTAPAPNDLSFKEYPSSVDSVLVPELQQITQTIKPNIAAYKAAASRWGIPWQAIAATHWREGSASSKQSMVNGTKLPTSAELHGKEYIWGSADATISLRSDQKSDIPTGNGGAPPRRFYGKSVQDVDYATWLLIQHGVRSFNPGFNGDPDKFIAKAQNGGLTKEEWTNTWSAYLGGSSMGYGSFGRDNGGRMGAGAIMAYLGGLTENPPVPSVSKYPGSSDSDYDKVAGGVNGSISASDGSCDTSSDGSSGTVSSTGYAFPIAAKKKSDYNTFGALSAVPCNNSGGCHHWEKSPSGGFAFDLGVSGYGPDRSQNAPVYAISGGSIVDIKYSRTNPSSGAAHSCNQFEFLSDKDGYQYWYGHLALDTSIKAGQKFKAGQQIGKVGPSYCADDTAPHLHIDRGAPKGQPGGYEDSRDPGIIPLINSLFEELPS